jgi:hypothetical protein
MTGRRLVGLGFAVAAAALLAAPSASAQPACNLSGEHLMSWPDANPVWQFCWLRPQDSSGSRGSGLEIRDVYYNGHMVLKRGHVPMLNVQYNPGGCGCYRDWQYQQDYFTSDGIITQGVYAEPTSPPLTVCDVGGGVDTCTSGQPNCFNGVAAEKLADRLILTTQFEAGWYRYMMKWRFFLDGRIQPVFGFSAVNASCINYTHKHHAYWRLDFDIDGPDNDIATEGPNPSPGPRPGPRYPIVPLQTETMRVANRPDITWSVIDSQTHRGYRIVQGDEVALPADTFSEGDLWLLKYNANEIDDGGTISNCPVNFTNFLNGESTVGDIVVWYRTGWLHIGGDLADCDQVGPTLYPIGDWSPPPGPH